MSVLARFRLDDRVVVLTGASAGLGAGFAQALAEVGADLVLVARRASALEAVADKLRAGGSRVLAVAADVGDPEACRRVAEQAVAEFGRIDVLINNAGIGSATPAVRESSERFNQVLAVNLGGCMWMAQACQPHMPAGSAIVNVASVLAHIGPRWPNSAYAASKAGVLGLTRDLAQEWSARFGIRVNVLCPGYFASEMTAEGAHLIEEMLSVHSILPRMGSQAELDAALLFLASSASSYVTGTSLVVDGGLSAL